MINESNHIHAPASPSPEPVGASGGDLNKLKRKEKIKVRFLKDDLKDGKIFTKKGTIEFMDKDTAEMYLKEGDGLIEFVDDEQGGVSLKDFEEAYNKGEVGDSFSSKQEWFAKQKAKETKPKEIKHLYKYECLDCGAVHSTANYENLKCSCGTRNLKLLAYEDGTSPPESISGSNKINFDFPLFRTEIKNISELKQIIEKNFPSIWFETKACLSCSAALSLKNLNGCPSLNLVGNPSGEKTTILSFFYGQDKTYISDDFTPRAFVSHSANVKAEELEQVDLLPKLKNKVLITPELAPLFEAPKDKLIDNFAMLTRVLDGEGLNRDSGTHGHRGYSGDYKFVWLGATTPLRASVWNVMGKIGNRLFFLNLRDKNRSDADFLEMFRGKAYEEKVKECRGAVKSFLDNHFKNNPVRSKEWDAEGDIFLLPEIIKYAKLLSKLRGSLMLWKSEEQGKYEFNFPIIEEPPRAINALYNLAKGHAIINNRNFLRSEDLEIVRAVCFSSMPHDRVEFLRLLGKHEGKLTTSQIQNELNCSDETARKTMNIFKILGIVDIKSIQIDYSSTGRPMNYIEIRDEFKELLRHTQSINGLENNKPTDNKGVCDDYSNVKPEDFIKNTEKKADTHHSNHLEKSFPTDNKCVCDQFGEEVNL